MTLGTLKKKTLALIEEIDENEADLTNDPDIAAKLPYVINQILHELARVKKIPAYTEDSVEKNEIYDLATLTNFYQLYSIKNVDFEYLDDLHVKFLEDGTARFRYYKYPNEISTDTADTTTLDLSDDVLEIAPYGIAADVLKADVSNQYGQIYANRYMQMLQALDSRYGTTLVEFDGGIDI